MKDANDLFLKTAKILGYDSKEKASFEGFCRGIAIRWIESKLSKQSSLFSQRIDRLFDDEQLIEQVTRTKKKFSQTPHVTMTPEDLELFELLGFIERAMLYQEPALFKHMLGLSLKQTDIEEISTIASSDIVSDMGGLESSYQEIGSYTLESFQHYLEELATTVDETEPPIESSVCFLVSNFGHATAISYDPVKHKWDAMDVNQWPPIQDKTIQEIAEYLHAGFLKTGLTPPAHMALNVTLVKTASTDFHSLPERLILLKESRPADSWSHQDWSLLYLAIRLGELNIVRKLLIEGVSAINPDFDLGLSPLILSAQFGNIGILRLLLDHGASASLNYRGTTKNKAIHCAASAGHADLIEVLIQLGAEINDPGNNDSTPLFLASENGNLSVVKILTEKYHAEINKPNKIGETPLLAAIRTGHSDVAAWLIDHHADVNKSGKNGETPLILAAQTNNAHIIELLCQHEANVDLPFRSYMFQIRQGHMVKLYQTERDATALYIAAKEGNTNAVECLLKHGAAVDNPTKYGRTPLHVAASKGHLSNVMLLVERGANLNVFVGGVTPLFLAAQNGYLDIVKFIAEQDKTSLNLPFIESAARLRDFASQHPEGVKERMHLFIEEQLLKGEDEYSLSVLPSQIARIMGHNDITDYLSEMIAHDEPHHQTPGPPK